MKKSVIVVLLLTIIFCVQSCMKDSSKIDSFVLRYRVLDTISLKQVDDRTLRIGISYQKNARGFVKSYSYDEKDEKRFFDSLAQKHLDIGFKSTITTNKYYAHAKLVQDMFACDFLSIDVSCTQNYNTTHPSSKNLNDIVRYLSTTCYPFIRERYPKVYLSDIEKQTSELAKQYIGLGLVFHTPHSYDFFKKNMTPYSPIDKMVNNLTKNDLILVGNTISLSGVFPGLGFLYFTELPDVPGEYDITVKMEGDDGKIYSATTKMKF